MSWKEVFSERGKLTHSGKGVVSYGQMKDFVKLIRGNAGKHESF